MPGQVMSRRSLRGPIPYSDCPRPELTAIHELEADPLDQTGKQRRAVSCKDRLHRNSYSSIRPRFTKARGSVTPPTHRPSPDSCLSC
jgi:hypothetical protein